ncbi:MAG TPA: bifunctional methylenetetrahydrofolate dehydrogenase/methenyltetrahydrofolate cyclohydrolase FolD [Candidatus Poseidoniales archaeon]|nr:MAG TPA: bifunctional methylenetetrahydrofolate dehydrogenase/methenyltetrahydrofolate cyclohydrolase FolD [Candidatus Poseidoniales archaeon]HII26371.1 bifunctional methylenetetrahydrofolate dehydrogenase/methenyltetrahydrofolate cyclohydrolase FolD [Candidatus Thalassarchaeaceae archaeon]
MPATIIDGKKIAREIEAELIGRITDLSKDGVVPCLAVVIVGDDPASHVYVGAKERACARLGIRSVRVDVPSDAEYEEVASTVRSLNEDPGINGVLVQSPLPSGMDEISITDLIDPHKDVDGFHAQNLGRLVQGDVSGLLPCTPAGVMRMLESTNLDIRGKRAVVIGRSRIVGMPQSILLAQRGVDATVTIAHSRTSDMADLCRSADLIVAAVGSPNMITADWIKPGATVIDVGVNRVNDDSEKGYYLSGDVHPGVREVAGAVSPVPGGVGPMTIAMLMSNTVRATEMQQ